MSKVFKVGDHVRWNSEAGHVIGDITKVHTSDIKFMGRMRRCSKEQPQYEVESDKTENHAIHKAGALEHWD